MAFLYVKYFPEFNIANRNINSSVCTAFLKEPHNIYSIISQLKYYIVYCFSYVLLLPLLTNW